jgi:hypothetical protein
MRILGSIVAPSTTLMQSCDSKITGSGSIRSQIVRDQLVWDKAILLHVSQPVRSPGCYFAVGANRRHSRGLGRGAPVSGRQFPVFRSVRGGFRAPASALGMAESHVISALRLKRAEISGYIHDLEKRIARQRGNLANLDATIRLFSPGTNPDAIPAKRPYRRTRYFARNELSRLVMDALRLATGPLAATDIATATMRVKGAAEDDAVFKAIVAER